LATAEPQKAVLKATDNSRGISEAGTLDEIFQEMEKHRMLVEATVIPYVKVEAVAADDLKPWDSKFQGVPYLPADVAYPRGRDGQKMYLIAQINFDNVPDMEPLPKSGLLQFWLNAGDPLETGDFRVMFHEVVEQEELQSEKVTTDGGKLPVFEHPDQAYRLTFTQSQMPMTSYDYRFEEHFAGTPDFVVDLYEEYLDRNGNFGNGASLNEFSHRIGGYPSFVQFDPRGVGSSGSQADKDFLLLQIDTDPDNGIMWGDTGVGHFFISSEKLEDKDFSDVLFSWDAS